MKLLSVISLVCASLLSTAISADQYKGEENTHALQLTSQSATQEQTASALAISQTFYYPRRTNQYGNSDLFFLNTTNGNQFCKEMGYRSMTSGSLTCGEDESEYNNYDWYQQRWVSKSTGSKNQCYALFQQITCSK